MFFKIINNFTYQEDWIHNFTDTTLPQHVKTILALSPNFAFPNSTHSQNKIIIEMIKSIKTATYNIETDLKNEFAKPSHKNNRRLCQQYNKIDLSIAFVHKQMQ